MKFKEKIEEFISSKQEGTNWDFKKIPHENKASLLHDIISMANCDCEDDRYIILGVSDGGTIEGLTLGQKNRKTQTNLIDFLRKKKFAGDMRPEVELETIELKGKAIDVIVVLNKPNKPYYLTEDYKDKGKIVKANHIYTRILDTNTPIDESADLRLVEEMWKERFGLTLSPLERMKLLLNQPEDWFKDLGNKNYAYHKQFPEFRIEFIGQKEIEEGEVCRFFYTSSEADIGAAIFKYHSTTLFELEYLVVDGSRLEIGKPKLKQIKLGEQRNWYCYFNLSSLNGIFHYFLTNGKIERKSRLDEGCQFLFFKNGKEQDEFNDYLKENEKHSLE